MTYQGLNWGNYKYGGMAGPNAVKADCGMKMAEEFGEFNTNKRRVTKFYAKIG